MLLLRFLIYAVAILITVYLLPGVTLASPWVTLIVAIVLSLINLLLRPIIILFTLPINILTLGLFTFVINALLVMLASWLVPGFMVSGFWWAIAFSLVLTIINAFLKNIIKNGSRQDS